MKGILFLSFVFIFSYQTARAEDYFSEMAKMNTAWNNVRDYSCNIYMKEYINGEYIEHKVEYKFMQPKSYYLKNEKGTEAIYREGKNKNKLLVNAGTFLPKLAIDPLGSLAMKDSRHSVLESDIGSVLKLLKQTIELAQKNQEGVFSIEGSSEAQGTKTFSLRSELPQKSGYYLHINQVFVDEKLNLPTKIRGYDWAKTLVEEYTYSDIKINTGLSDIDFDPSNSRYHF